MKVERSSLLEVLDKVRVGLAKQGLVVEQADCFIFEEGKVSAYNGEISVTCPVDLDITGAVAGEELYGLVSRSTSAYIGLSIKENELLVKVGKTRAGLPLHSEVNPPPPDLTNVEWKELPPNFLDSVRFCLPACAKNMSLLVFTCLHVLQDRVESTDGYRVSIFRLDGNIDIQPFLLPADSGKKLLNYEVKEIAQQEGWVHFRSVDGCTFSARVVEGEFPDVSKVDRTFEESDKKSVTLPPEIGETLERAAIFTKQDFPEDKFVILEFDKGELKVKAEGSRGWFEEEMPVDYSGERIAIGINPLFLREICSQSNQLQFSDKIAKFEGENWIHLMALRDV